MRPIDADTLKKEILETYEHEYPTESGAFDEFVSRIVPNIISNAPTIDAVPVVHGRWEVVKEYDELDPRMICSACGEIDMPLARWSYCPNCGARMDLEEE